MHTSSYVLCSYNFLLLTIGNILYSVQGWKILCFNIISFLEHQTDVNWKRKRERESVNERERVREVKFMTSKKSFVSLNETRDEKNKEIRRLKEILLK